MTTIVSTSRTFVPRRLGSQEFELPAGTYIVGDPCYQFDEQEAWADLLDSCDFFAEPVGEANGITVIAFSTAFGDGCYNGSDGNEYAVDAGIIGIMRAFPGQTVGELSHEITFKAPFHVTCVDGEFTFGSLTIDTDPSPECAECATDDDSYDGLCYSCWEESQEEKEDDE